MFFLINAWQLPLNPAGECQYLNYKICSLIELLHYGHNKTGDFLYVFLWFESDCYVVFLRLSLQSPGAHENMVILS